MDDLNAGAFREAMRRQLGVEYEELHGRYRNQSIRRTVISALCLAGVVLGVSTYLPATMVFFLLFFFLIYAWYFRRGRRAGRVVLSEELRRLLGLHTASLCSDRKPRILSHRYFPLKAFQASGLFAFDPARYEGDEMFEIGGKGRDGSVEFARILAVGEEDAFGGDGEAGRFEGWLYRIRPRDGRFPETGGLPEDHRFHFDGDFAWLAVPFPGKLYRAGLFSFRPDWEQLHRLYRATRRAVRMAGTG